MSDFTLDTREFSEALQFVRQATKKDAVTLLNRAGLHVVIGGKGVKGAMQRTPKADPKKIQSTLERNVGGKGASEGVKIYKNQYGTFSRRTSRSKGAAGNSMLKYIALKRLQKAGTAKPNEGQIQAVMDAIMRQRVSAAGYTAYAGWNNAAKAFGGTGLKGKKAPQKGFRSSKAAHGYGSKASARALEAVLANTAPMAGKIGAAALQAAVNDVARDLVEYGTRKIQQTMNKASAK